MYKVWAIPLSLAATYGVEFSFLSCRYLDVSVPCVGPCDLWIQPHATEHNPSQVSLFGDPGINGWLAPTPGLSQLPHVLRRLLTPILSRLRTTIGLNGLSF